MNTEKTANIRNTLFFKNYSATQILREINIYSILYSTVYSKDIFHASIAVEWAIHLPIIRLISRKIWVTEKFLKIHTVWKKLCKLEIFIVHHLSTSASFAFFPASKLAFCLNFSKCCYSKDIFLCENKLQA